MDSKLPWLCPYKIEKFDPRDKGTYRDNDFGPEGGDWSCISIIQSTPKFSGKKLRKASAVPHRPWKEATLLIFILRLPAARTT